MATMEQVNPVDAMEVELAPIEERPEERRTNLRVLPAAANWYCSQVCDWGYDAEKNRMLIVYGANNVLCLYEFALRDPVAPIGKPPSSIAATLVRPLRTNFIALLRRGKKDGRVTSVRCVTDSSGKMLIACGGEEGAVQLWDPVSLSRVDQHRGHNNAEVTCLAPGFNMADWIIGGDRQGCISIWQRDTASVQTFVPIPRDAVFSMEIAPHDKTLVAVGYRSGALCLVDVLNKSIRHRLDGHDLEVQSVSWSPVRDGAVYLASASKDRMIKVWSVPPTSDGGDTSEPATVARLEVRKPQQASSQGSANRLWLPVTWSISRCVTGKYGLWSGSYEGNLQLWQWNGAPKGTVKPAAVFKNGHNRFLFGIVPARIPLPFSDVVNGTNHVSPPTTSYLLTVSLDRDLRIWSDATETSTSNLKSIERIAAQGGFVYSLDFHRQRNLLACGVGDQTIRLWSLCGAKQSAGGYQAETVWKGMQSKVTCVRWHPLQDHILAFGTEDGRVGTWDSRSKTTQRFKFTREGSIQSLEWGVHRAPSREEATSTDFIQSMKALEVAQADGLSLEEALANQDSSHSASAQEVQVLLWSLSSKGELCRTDVETQKTQRVLSDCSAFAWSTSCLTVAIGAATGKIELHAWTSSDVPLELVKSIHEHKEAVTALAWSSSIDDPETASQLASGSAEGDIVVYQVEESSSSQPVKRQAPIGYGRYVTDVFKNHTGSINCLRWSSPTDGGSATLASSGNDGTVHVWQLGQLGPCAAYRLHFGRVFAVEWICSHVLASAGQDQTIRLWDYRSHGHSSDGDPPKVSATGPSASSSADIVMYKGKSEKPPKKKSSKKTESVLSASYAQKFTQEVLSQAQSVLPNEIVQSHRRLLEHEADQQQKDENWEQAAHNYLLQGRITEALRLVASHGLLSPYWVAYAPMAGQDVWRQTAKLYALQLESAGDFKEAALQFLAISQVDSAIEALRKGALYPEATSLALSRYGPDAPLLSSILWEHASSLEKKKRVNEAVSTYLAIKSSDARMRAVTLLIATGNLGDARQGLKLYADVCDGGSLPTSVLTSILKLSMQHQDFKLATSALDILVRGGDSPRAGSTEGESSSMLYELGGCVMRICDLLVNVPEADDDQVSTTSDESQKLPVDVIAFIDHLQHSANEDGPERATRIWTSALHACMQYDLTSRDKLEIAVEELAGKNVLAFLLSLTKSDEQEKLGGSIIVRIGHHVLKVLVELLSGYLVSALEELHGLLLLLVEDARGPQPANWFNVLFLGAIIDPQSPPTFGEFGDEPEATRVLWIERFLLQCDLVITNSMHTSSPEEKRAALERIARLRGRVSGLTKNETIPEALSSKAQQVYLRMNEAMHEDRA